MKNETTSKNHVDHDFSHFDETVIPFIIYLSFHLSLNHNVPTVHFLFVSGQFRELYGTQPYLDQFYLLYQEYGQWGIYLSATYSR